MKILEEAIINYIKNSNTDYAIQINGHWGAGKTHYVKQLTVNKEEDFKEEKKKAIYISLNGLQTIEDLKSKLLNEIVISDNALLEKYGEVKERFGDIKELLPKKWAVGATVINTLLSEKNEYELENESNFRYILFLDDLERLSEKLDYRDLFGFVSSYCLDTFNMKVIFISNSAEIMDQVTFNKIKEKIIFNTYDFRSVHADSLRELVETRFEPINIYQILEKNYLYDLFEKFFKESNFNLRTVLYIISSFNNIIKGLNRDFGNEKEDIYKILLNNLLIIATEYKNGELKHIEQLNRLYGIKQLTSLNIKEGSYESKLLNSIDPTYKYEPSSAFFSKEISNYVINGTIDYERLTIDLKNHLVVETDSDTPIKEALNVLHFFRQYSDSQIREAQKIIYGTLEMIDKDTLEYGQYLCGFYNMDLFMLDSIDNPINKIIRSLEQGNYDKDYFQNDNTDILFSIKHKYYGFNSNQDFEKLYNIIKNIIADEHQENIKKKIDSLSKQSFNELYRNVPDNGFDKLNLIDLIIEEHVEKNILVSPSKADYFQYILEKSWFTIMDQIPHVDSLNSVNNLITKLNGYRECSIDRVDKFKIKELIDKLKFLKQGIQAVELSEKEEQIQKEQE